MIPFEASRSHLTATVPVIFIGIFDRDVGERALMWVPELYERGRKGKLFGLVRFTIYMLDGIYQVGAISLVASFATND